MKFALLKYFRYGAAVALSSTSLACHDAGSVASHGCRAMVGKLRLLVQCFTDTIHARASRHLLSLTIIEEGDEEIDKIIRSEKDTNAMARELSTLVQRLKGDGQVNASRHLVNLTSDENYGLIASLLVNPKINPDVIEVLFADLQHRRLDLRLPVLLTILKTPAHPQNKAARQIMRTLANKDFGKNYPAWDKWMNAEIERVKVPEK